MQKLQKTEHPHIVKVPGIAGGRPTIAGTRIRVELIARFLKDRVGPNEILAMYPHLTPAAVYDAISYYYDHQDEIDRFLEENTLEAVLDRYGLVVGEDGRLVPRRE